MTIEDKKTKLEEAKEMGILTEKEYKKKIKSLEPIPEPTREKFSWAKLLKGMFSMLDPVEWAQTFREIGITDVRKWIVVVMILGCLYGWGYLKGVGNQAVHFDMRGEEAMIALNEHYLHVLPDGSAQVEDENGNILKSIRVKDIPALRKALLPVGFDFKPFVTTGVGVGSGDSDNSDVGLEAGIGTSVFKFYKWHLDTWLSNKGVYLGADYKLTDNFGVISGVGQGYEGEKRIYLGGKWNF